MSMRHVLNNNMEILKTSAMFIFLYFILFIIYPDSKIH